MPGRAFALLLSASALSVDDADCALTDDAAGALGFGACVEKVLSDPRTHADAGEAIFDGCRPTGKAVAALVKGVQDAGFLDVTDEAFQRRGWVVAGDSLTAKLHTSQLYGELASKSKIPSAWVLQKEFGFVSREENGQQIVKVSGVSFEPCKQGLELYEQLIGPARCTEAELEETRAKLRGATSSTRGNETCERCFKNAWLPAADAGKPDPRAMMPACIAREKKAANDAIAGFYAGLPSDRSEDRKIDRIVRDFYSDKKVRAALTAAGEWGNIFWTYLVGKPFTLDELVFSSEAPAGVKAIVTYPEDWEGEAKFGISTKIAVGGAAALLDAGTLVLPAVIRWTIGISNGIEAAEKFARSAMAFAEMMTWGEWPQTLGEYWKASPHMGDPDALLNLFSRCSKPASEGECEGRDIGRISWSPEPGPRMQ